MSSTDGQSGSRSDERGRAMLQRFFEREILPLAKSPGWERSDTAPDPALASYWKDLILKIFAIGRLLAVLQM